MPFGYVPHYSFLKNLITRAFGYPNMVRRIQAPVLMKMLDPRQDEAILDAGCGSGFFAYEVAGKCRLCIGIDWNPAQGLSLAVSHRPTVAYMKGDVEQLPYVSGAFDKVLLSSVLQMVRHDRESLDECHRVLKENGSLVLSVPVGYTHIKGLNDRKSKLKEVFGTLGKAYYVSYEVIELLASAGFKVVRTEYAPKWWGSLVFEIGLYLNQRFRFPFLSPFLFPFFYPLAWFDRLADSKQIGDEFIIKARKIIK